MASMLLFFVLLFYFFFFFNFLSCRKRTIQSDGGEYGLVKALSKNGEPVGRFCFTVLYHTEWQYAQLNEKFSQYLAGGKKISVESDLNSAFSRNQRFSLHVDYRD